MTHDLDVYWFVPTRLWRFLQWLYLSFTWEAVIVEMSIAILWYIIIILGIIQINKIVS